VGSSFSPACRSNELNEHLLPLISERGWNPVYLGVVQPPDAKGLLTIDYSESLGVEYIPGCGPVAQPTFRSLSVLMLLGADQSFHR
jgi:hypothetical protein